MTKKNFSYSTTKLKLFHDIKSIISSPEINLLLLNFIFMKLFIIFSLFIKSNNNINNEVYYSYITLKSNKTGNIKLFSDNAQPWPDELWINYINQTGFKNEYYLNDINDIIKLIWHKKPTSINSLFKDCSNITEIDLSNFDTSEIIFMADLFNGCTSLQKINLSNLNTSKVKIMSSMFSGCSSLTYLDLSYFNTILVENIKNMFYNCTNLSSLIFPYLDMKQVNNNYDNFLQGCKNLKFLNLKEANIENDNIIYDMFNSVPENILVCTINNLNLGIIFSKYCFVNCMKNINERYYYSLCYTNDLDIYNNKHICDICGSNFHQIYGYSDYTLLQINCYESIDNFCSNYFYYNLTSNIIYCTEDKTKLINNIIQELINNYKDIDNGIDKIIYEKNLSIILTSTLN